MKKKCNREIKRYKIYDYTNPDIQVSFHINTTPYSEHHYHDFWEVMVMLKNNCINVINDKKYSLVEREIQILRPNDLHYCQKMQFDEHQLLNMEVKTDFFEMFVAMFKPSLLQELTSYGASVPKIRCSETFYEELIYLISLAQRYCDVDAEERQYLSKRMLALILFEFEEAFNLGELKKHPDKSFSNKMILLFNQPENMGLKLNEVCKKYPCSVEYAIRKFKEEGMDTPNKIFRKIKLDYACLLLKTTDTKIIFIAEKVGYRNLGFFNKLFVETYGVAPKEYRKLYRDARY